MSNPTGAQIKAVRMKAGITQDQAAKLLHMTRVAFNMAENGNRKLSLPRWELLLIKTGQHPEFGKKVTDK